VATLGGTPVAVIALRDSDRKAGDTERVAIEHATTVLAMEVARLPEPAEAGARLRTDLVLGLVGGGHADAAETLNRAQALGYNLGQPHRVVVVEGQQPGHEIGVLFHAVRRAAREVRVGSLLAPRLHDVIVLANREVPWDQFRERVVTEIHGGRCRIGVGGRCGERIEFPHSYWQAELALRIQKAVRGPEWLGPLMSYDAEHGAQLVLTLSEYLDCAVRTALDVNAYVEGLEKHLRLTLFTGEVAGPEGAVLLVRGALAGGDRSRATRTWRPRLAMPAAWSSRTRPLSIMRLAATARPVAATTRWRMPAARGPRGLTGRTRRPGSAGAHALYEQVGAADEMASVRACLRVIGIRRLFLSTHTVTFHLRHVFWKGRGHIAGAPRAGAGGTVRARARAPSGSGSARRYRGLTPPADPARCLARRR
jgi:hypothetical protein